MEQNLFYIYIGHICVMSFQYKIIIQMFGACLHHVLKENVKVSFLTKIDLSTKHKYNLRQIYLT